MDRGLRNVTGNVFIQRSCIRHLRSHPKSFINIVIYTFFAPIPQLVLRPCYDNCGVPVSPINTLPRSCCSAHLKFANALRIRMAASAITEVVAAIQILLRDISTETLVLSFVALSFLGIATVCPPHPFVGLETNQLARSTQSSSSPRHTRVRPRPTRRNSSPYYQMALQASSQIFLVGTTYGRRMERRALNQQKCS
jgi:hypothetical protein